MTLAEYDALILQAQRLEAQSQDLHAEAMRLQQRAEREAGIVHVPRESGFPCWTHPQLANYYWTPREVVEALEGVMSCRNTT
jgi:hypothetical protein